MIIGVCGFIGSGKDTIADYLTNFHGYRRESFANSLKDAVAQVFGWDRTMLEGRTKQAREWREQVDPWWSERLKMPNLTPRWILQYWGTEVCRRAFHDDIWIASLENKLRNSKDDVVIRVVRGAEPDWYNDAADMNAGDRCMNYMMGKTRMQLLGIHASETAWVGTKFDAVMDNNGTIDDLYEQVLGIISPEQGHLDASERPLYAGLVRS